MFSGIVETTTKIREWKSMGSGYRLQLERPPTFDDLKIGDSICCDGVCLTLESTTIESMDFFVGQETLQITDWLKRLSGAKQMNVERSLRLSDRIHGHLVTGHVDGIATVTAIKKDKDFCWLRVKLPPTARAQFWKKGSLTLNGVSLTVNEVLASEAEVYLIPETLQRTNLVELDVGSQINFETDYLAKAILRQQELASESN